jgi:uncharacterized phage protein gp47/JayE
MAIDDLPGDFVTINRDEIAENYRRDVRIRNPNALTGPGTQPDLDARTFADGQVPLYNDATLIANAINEDEATGEGLERVATRLGLGDSPRTAAVGATGFVTVDAAISGGNILAGDQLTEPNSGLKYECTLTKLYADGEQAPIKGTDTGPLTNQDVGVVLQWDNPRPGIGPNATVATDSQGEGLTGGSDEETDAQLRNRIKDRRANPAASGNDAEIQDLAEDKLTGVAVEKAFTYPAILGPGSTGLTFTVRPAGLGRDRKPSAAQLTAVESYVIGQLPADDSVFMLAMLQQLVDIVLSVEFAAGAAGFTDDPTWPPYQASLAGPGAVIISAATDALNFTIATDDADYTGMAQPIIGQALAVWDTTTDPPAFRKKVIQSFTGTGAWVVVVEDANAASDTTYVPVVGQRVMPWSDSLEDLVDPVLRYFDALGPGENTSVTFRDGRRQRRTPRPTQLLYPNEITNNLIATAFGTDENGNPYPTLLELDSVLDAVITEGLGTTTTVGTPAVSVNLIELDDLAVFPL